MANNECGVNFQFDVRTVIIIGEDLIRRLMTESNASTLEHFNLIALEILKIHGHDITPEEAPYWCLGVTNQYDLDLLNSYLSANELEHTSVVDFEAQGGKKKCLH